MNLCLAIPYYGAAHALFFRALNQLFSNAPCNLAMIDLIGDSLVPRARNTLVWKFLHQSDSDAILFIDSDIIFHPGHVSRIISHDLEKYPCIGGVYPKKKVQPTWVLNTFEEGPNQPGDDGLLKVRYAGTGFMLITRKVLEEITAAFPARAYAADIDEEGTDRFDFFPIGPRNHIVPDAPDIEVGKERYLSEDWAFSEMVRSLGYDVMVDTEVRVEHYGGVSYPIKADDILSRQAVTDLHIGRRTQLHLTNVTTFHAESNPETNGAMRLIDVDALVAAISPPVLP